MVAQPFQPAQDTVIEIRTWKRRSDDKVLAGIGFGLSDGRSKVLTAHTSAHGTGDAANEARSTLDDWDKHFPEADFIKERKRFNPD